MKQDHSTEQATGPRCACEGGTLTRFIQPVILHILSCGPQNGYQIKKQMSEYALFREESPDATGIYRYLKAMEKRSLIQHQKSDFDSSVLYELTKAGEVCLSSWMETLDKYQQDLAILIGQLKI